MSIADTQPAAAMSQRSDTPWFITVEEPCVIKQEEVDEPGKKKVVEVPSSRTVKRFASVQHTSIVWREDIVSRFSANTLVHKRELLDRISHTKMVGFPDVKTYVRYIQEQNAQLSRLAPHMAQHEEVLQCYILSAAPKELDDVVAHLEKDENLSFNTVVHSACRGLQAPDEGAH